MFPPNQTVTVSITNPTSMDSRDDGDVNLRIEDAASGECLVDVTIPAGRWWRLCQGSRQTWPAFVGTHPERIGKTLQTRVVTLPPELPGDTGRDRHRDVYKAASEQAPDFLDYQEHSIRLTNRGREAVLRRWVDTKKAGTD